tara:strand:+ start:1252 stop:2298 length:1047 start_codon:yes stop_codon:yes gene_type:complete
MKKIFIKIVLKIYNFFDKEHEDFSTHNLDELNNFFISSKLVLFDIGSRSASKKSIASRLDLLKKYSTLIICDADTSSMDESIKKLSNEGWKNIKKFPYALSNIKQKFINLYLTKQTGLSSLLKPNESYIKNLPKFIRNDFSITNEIKVPNKKLINVLDELDSEEISHIDIDTQGTELDILKSGEEIIEKNLISLTIEVSFHEIYRNQCLFKDVDNYLSNFGFEIFELDRSMILNSPDINYSKKILFQGDALYFKNPDFIIKNHKNPGHDLMKLISMLVTFHHFNGSLKILNDKKFRQLISSTYNDSKIKSLENEIKIYSNKFKYHNKIFLNSYKLRKYIYKDRDNLYH